MKDIKLQEADRAEITVVIDNYTDMGLVDSTEIVKRAPAIVENRLSGAPLAEHGLSLLIKVFKDAQCHTLLFDTGWSNVGVPYNLKLYGTKLDEIESIVLSENN